MKKRIAFLVALVFIISTALAACGKTETSKTTTPTTKNYAVGTMTEGEVPVNVKVDVSTGLSVVFSNDGFLLYDGEFDDSTYPLVTATILKDEVYEKYLADNKDRDDFKEDDGFYKYTSSIGEPCCLYKIGDKIPFMLSFEKGTDGDKADEIIKCIEFDY